MRRSIVPRRLPGPTLELGCGALLLWMLASSSLFGLGRSPAPRDVGSLTVPSGWSRVDVTNALDGALSAIAADIDGDGRLDIVGVGSVMDQIKWWQNLNGQGTSWAERMIAVSFDFPSSIHAADVDGDGDLDVLATGDFADEIAWWENLFGDGTSWSKHSIDDFFNGATSVSTGDIDGDGDTDVLGTAKTADDVTWWENVAGDGTLWAEHTIADELDFAREVIGADIDGDGDLDVLAVNDPFPATDDSIRWWENVDGDGSIWAETTIDDVFNGVVSIAAEDIDGDGDTDVAAAATAADSVAWWENTLGDGSAWARRTVDNSVEMAEDVSITDLDRDGDMDLLGASSAQDEMLWWENLDGRGVDWATRSIDSAFVSARSNVPGDFDGDGDLDVLGAAFVADRIAWWQNLTIHAKAEFQDGMEIAAPSDQTHVALPADLDGDGDIDLVTASEDDSTIRWFESDGGAPPTFVTRTPFSPVDGGQSLFAIDVTDDGEIDLLAASSGDDSIRLFQNDGGTPPLFSEQLISSTADGAFSVFGADLDADGDVDVLAASRTDDTVRWFENDGSSPPNFLEQVITTSADGARSVYAADLDDDGDLDVLSASREDDTVAWYENSGGSPPTFTARAITTTADGARSVYAADFDGDGRIDVLAGSELDDSVRLFTNEGGDPPTFAEQVITSVAFGALSVTGADVDLDGDLDALSASRDDDALRWYENDGNSPPLFTPHDFTTNAPLAQSIAAADLDGDGDPDAAAAALLGFKVAWYENCLGQFELATTDIAPDTIVDGGTDAFLAIEWTHRGRPGDGDISLRTIELLFEKVLAVPLTTEQAKALIDTLDIYLDDGDGVLDPQVDRLVGRELDLTLTLGFFTFEIAPGNLDFQISAQESATYFVAVTLTDDASDQEPDSFRISHLTESGGPQSAAADSGFGTPLTLLCVGDEESGIVTAVPGLTPSTLEVSGTCPGQINVILSGAEPNTPITFVSSDAEGVFVKPQPPCEGLELGLATPNPVASGTTSPNGTLLLTPNVTAAACGRFLQAVETARCLPSNVDQLPLAE